MDYEQNEMEGMQDSRTITKINKINKQTWVNKLDVIIK